LQEFARLDPSAGAESSANAHISGPAKDLNLYDLAAKSFFSLHDFGAGCRHSPQFTIFKELKMVLGQIRRPSLERDTLLSRPNQKTLSHWSGWESVMAHTGWM